MEYFIYYVSVIYLKYEYTLAAVIVCISRVTSFFTVSSLFVTQRVVQTVNTTVVDTLISIGPGITLCNISY